MSEKGDREITYLEAVREAMTAEMRRDPEVFLLGEDGGGDPGGLSRSTEVNDEIRMRNDE